jgi:hypothetical protein
MSSSINAAFPFSALLPRRTLSLPPGHDASGARRFAAIVRALLRVAGQTPAAPTDTHAPEPAADGNQQAVQRPQRERIPVRRRVRGFKLLRR